MGFEPTTKSLVNKNSNQLRHAEGVTQLVRAFLFTYFLCPLWPAKQSTGPARHPNFSKAYYCHVRSQANFPSLWTKSCHLSLHLSRDTSLSIHLSISRLFSLLWFRNQRDILGLVIGLAIVGVSPLFFYGFSFFISWYFWFCVLTFAWRVDWVALSNRFAADGNLPSSPRIGLSEYIYRVTAVVLISNYFNLESIDGYLSCYLSASKAFTKKGARGTPPRVRQLGICCTETSLCRFHRTCIYGYWSWNW